MKTYKDDPRQLTARFDSTCAESGRRIRKGDPILYWPSERKAYLIGHAPKAEQDFRDFQASVFDECVYSGATW